MSRRMPRPYRRTVAVLTSMHAKERVIAPILGDALGLRVALALGVDTDRFGTFSGEVARSGSPLEAARAKIAAGFDYAPRARVGLASEGSFGPHPHVPFLAIGRELILLVDRETGLELTGFDASPDTNFGHAVVQDVDAAFAFAEHVRFPGHGLIVMGFREGRSAPDLMLDKDVTDTVELEAAVRRALDVCGAAVLEPDMRAHRNPTRMAAIARATTDLARRFHSRCPVCGHPGFDVTHRLPGLPCSLCGEPTRLTLTEILSCRSCRHRVERRAAAHCAAGPELCDSCNP